MSILLIQDTREQRGLSAYWKTPFIIDTLEVGDYSVAGLQSQIAIERKSLGDLLSTLTQGRERFERELEKTVRTFRQFYVVVEGRLGTIYRGEFEDKSLAHPKAIWESIAALTVRYHVPFLFCENREIAAALVESLLVKYAQEYLKTAHKIQVAARAAEI